MILFIYKPSKLFHFLIKPNNSNSISLWCTNCSLLSLRHGNLRWNVWRSLRKQLSSSMDWKGRCARFHWKWWVCWCWSIYQLWREYPQPMCYNVSWYYWVTINNKMTFPTLDATQQSINMIICKSQPLKLKMFDHIKMRRRCSVISRS